MTFFISVIYYFICAKQNISFWAKTDFSFAPNTSNIYGGQLSWSHGSWIYNYLCNQYLSPLTLWVRIPSRQCVLDRTLCDKVRKWNAAGRWSAGRWFSPGTQVSPTNNLDNHDNIEILKVALNPITLIFTLHLHQTGKGLIDWFFGVLTPLSAIFQLYHVTSFSGGSLLKLFSTTVQLKLISTKFH